MPSLDARLLTLLPLSTKNNLGRVAHAVAVDAAAVIAVTPQTLICADCQGSQNQDVKYDRLHNSEAFLKNGMRKRRSNRNIKPRNRTDT